MPSDFLTASRQFPSSFNLRGFGPNFCAASVLFVSRFVVVILRSVPLACKWRAIDQSLSFCRFDAHDGALTIVKLAVVPHKVEPPQVPMQVFPADVVVDAHESAFHQCVTAFRRIRVYVTTHVFLGCLAHGVMSRIFWANAFVGRKLIERCEHGCPLPPESLP